MRINADVVGHIFNKDAKDVKDKKRKKARTEQCQNKTSPCRQETKDLASVSLQRGCR